PVKRPATSDGEAPMLTRSNHHRDRRAALELVPADGDNRHVQHQTDLTRDSRDEFPGRDASGDERGDPTHGGLSPQRRLLVGKTCAIGGGWELHQPPPSILGRGRRLATYAA